MEIARLRQLTYLSHMALGFTGAVFFCVLVGISLYLLPRVESLLAHSDAAASNVTTATGIWANGAAAEAGQIDKIAHDTRASIAATGRLADKLTELASAAKSQVQQLGPLLESVKTASDSIAPAVDKIGDTAAAGTTLLRTTTATFAQFNDPDHGISPIMATYLKSGQDLNTILERQAIGKMLDSFAGIAHNGDLITGQFELVTKKASDDYLGPHPWYTKVGRFASDTYDYGALFARHAK
jgi:hypothetical protein